MYPEEPGQTNIIAQVTGYTPTINTRLLLTKTKMVPTPHTAISPSCKCPRCNTMYRRKSYSSRARRPIRSTGRRRSSRRVYRTKKRTYRKRGITMRKILNKTSRKKRDTMVLQTNVSTTTPVGNATYNRGPAPVSQNSIYIWCPTARDLSNSTGGVNPSLVDSARTATTCYMHGLKEKITFSTNDATPWLWRRVVIYSKDPDFRTSTSGAGSTFNTFIENSAGYARVVNQPVNGAFYDDRLWKGQINIDWDDFMTAPVDNSRNDVVYDKTVTMSSGAQLGMYRSFNRWHGINKNLVYGDDENGASTATSYWSVSDKRGCGDMYVIDIFKPGAGVQTNSVLYFKPEASLYWHEK